MRLLSSISASNRTLIFNPFRRNTRTDMNRERRNNGIFVTGTDTDIGKTIITAALYRNGFESGRNIVYIKAIQTGTSDVAPDVQTCFDAVNDLPGDKKILSLECFKIPCSPHLAAKIEGKRIAVEKIVEQIQGYQNQGYFVIVEGAGGIFVPLNDSETTLDLIQSLRLPVLLVFENRVGCINHVMLSVRELQRNDIPILGLVSNSIQSEPNPMVQADNIEMLGGLSGLSVLAALPRLPDLNSRESGPRLDAWKFAANKIQSVWKEINIQESNSQKNNQEEHKAPLYHSNRLDEITRFDREHLWHPYTSIADPHPVVAVSSAKNCTIYTEDGKELTDGMASWWAAIHGYNHPTLNEAVRSQLARMSHVMFGGMTHHGAVELGRKILDLTPANLDCVFFADSGSVSVEVALKMSLQYHQARGKIDKIRFMTFRGGYHGDTLGAMSVCDPINGMHSLFQGVLSKQIFLDRPTVPFDKIPCGDHFEREIGIIRSAFEKHAKETAAFILEPIIQGAGGMYFYHPEYLRRIRQFCNEYDVLFVADEIATGFGRSGKMFAVEWAGVEPDILCIGKALSGGYMTLAATLASRVVAEGISANGNVFMHGPTFMANPLACAVAGASLDLLNSGNWQGDVKRIESRLKTGLESCRNREGIADVRVLGAIGVIETINPVNTRRLQEFFVRKGVWIRPFNRLIYLMPPYCVSDGELDKLTEAVRDAVEQKEFLF